MSGQTLNGRPRPFAGTIRVPIATMGGHSLSLNSRVHWAAKAAETKKWRQFAAVVAARYPRFPKVTVTLTWIVKDKRRRDEDNLFLLRKALIDGLVDAGVVDDDSSEYVTGGCRIEYRAGIPEAFMELRVEGVT